MEWLHFSALIILMAFFCEYVDSSLGMGYGTALTPILLLMGYNPLQIVPCILLSELVTGLSAAFLHHRLKNVNFKIGTIDLKIALVMAGCSVFGALAAVFVALNLPKFYIKLYIGLLVFAMGVLILATLKRKFKFSWKKISSLGLLAAFNKGISGGGYGPIVT
ncbi:MAG: sulfite exporter TauE/SafE family protein, partial [Candidatus Aminicenantes bacterium]|nr:sulfite exporter TauE/SafE family protein [Candidatus Aminicenantes bacterium]